MATHTAFLPIWVIKSNPKELSEAIKKYKCEDLYFKFMFINDTVYAIHNFDLEQFEDEDFIRTEFGTEFYLFDFFIIPDANISFEYDEYVINNGCDIEDVFDFNFSEVVIGAYENRKKYLKSMGIFESMNHDLEYINDADYFYDGKLYDFGNPSAYIECTFTTFMKDYFTLETPEPEIHFVKLH